jgi:hypothetical protein
MHEIWPETPANAPPDPEGNRSAYQKRNQGIDWLVRKKMTQEPHLDAADTRERYGRDNEY